jgi:hypothetical protein
VFDINSDDVAEVSDEVFDKRHASVLNAAAAACARQAISVIPTGDSLTKGESA